MSPRQIVLRGILLGVLAAGVCAGAFLGYVSWYTGSGRLLPGVVVGQTPVGGLTVREARRQLAGGGQVRRQPVQAGMAGVGVGTPSTAGGATALGMAGGAPDTAGGTTPPGPDPAASARLVWADHEWQIGLKEIGALPDAQGALKEAAALSKDGTLLHQAAQFLTGLVHGYYVPEEPRLKEQVLTDRLTAIAKDVAKSAVDATYNFENDTVSDDVPGQALDVPASVQAVRQALQAGRREAELVVNPVDPNVRKQDLTDAHRYQIARFTTPILAANPGRLQNIAMAVRKISGVPLKPGQVFSFNDLVGPRDADHGWAQADELYQGEFVRGYGGGICQVSSTLYNAVLLAGLEVKERYHHDRPLQYIDPGRDATVAWNVLDFKFRNNMDVPVLIGARVLAGSPQQIEVTLYASRPLADGAIALEAADVRYFPPELEEIPDRSLPANARNVVDEGHYGIEVKIYRVFKEGGKERRELVSHDKYQPKAGKVRVGVGNAPGSERLLNPGLR